MSYLAVLITFKIVVTAVMVSAPLLFARPAFVASRTGAGAEAVPWLRLYGVAVTSLLVGYASAYWTIAAGAFPWGVVTMGVVSNAGATWALIATGIGRRAPALTAAFATIAVGLIAAMLYPELALTRAI
jgi:hypothetical protein